MRTLRRALAIAALLAALLPAGAMAAGVNTATGNFTQQEKDLSMPGLGVGFDLVRTYNSKSVMPGQDLDSPLGPGWRSNFQTSVKKDSVGNVMVTSADGQQALYLKVGTNYQAPDGIHSYLYLDSGVFTLETRDGHKTTYDETTGHVTSMTDRYDHGLSFTYTSDLLTSVTDEAGREVELDYVSAGGHPRLSTVTLPDERQVSYTYTEAADHMLETVTDATGAVTTYGYTDDGSELLDSVTDANEHVVLSNTYDGEGRVVSQEDALSQETTYAWVQSDGRLEATTTLPNGATYIDVYQGNLLDSTTDPLGNETAYAYDNNLNKTQITDGRGVVTQMTYDSEGRLLETSVPSVGKTESREYNPIGLLTRVTNAAGENTDYTWDGTQLTSIESPDGGISYLFYNGDNQVEEATDPRGNTVTYAYDADFNRISATTEEGRVSEWAYDASGRVAQTTDPEGGEVDFAYDEDNRVVSRTDELDRETVFDYDPVGNLVSTTDPDAGETTTAYDTLDRPTSVTDAEDRTTTTAYDEVGNVVSSTSPTGAERTYDYDLAGELVAATTARGNEPGADAEDFTWSYDYDEVGNRTLVTDPADGETTTVYDDLSRPVSVTDELGKTTEMAYDEVGNLVSSTDPNDNQTTTTYDEVNRPLVTTSPEGRTTTRAYDLAGNLVSLTDGAGGEATFTYDGDGFLASSVDPRGNELGADPDDFRTSYTRDGAGRVIEAEDPLSHTVQTTYDAAGNTLSVTDPNGHTTAYAYDDLDRVTSVTAPGSAVTSFTYDAVGNQLTRTDARSKTTTFAYDDDDRLVSTTLPTGGEVTTAYDAEGNPVETVTGRGNASLTPADGTITRTFDALGQLTDVNYGDATPDVSFGYDDAGQMTAMDDGPGAEAYAYDDAGRLTSITRGTDVLGYGYDDDGLITSRTQPGSVSIGATYDDAGRLATVTAAGVTSTYSYDAAGHPTGAALPSGTGYATARTYDDAGRLTAVENSNGTVLSRFEQTLDAAGNPTRIDTTRGGTTTSQAYTYDNRDRLTTWCPAATTCVSPSSSVAYSYDAVGNRTQQVRTNVASPGTTTYAYDDSNRMTSSAIAGGATTTYGYDEDGNQVQAGATDMTYDLENHLTSIDDGVATTDFAYDGAGKRLQATTGAAVTKFLWDPQADNAELVSERDGTGALIRRYTQGLAGTPLAMSDGSATSYFLPDLMGSTADLISSAGVAQARYAYEPFGASTETQLVGGAPANPVRFTGEYQDPSGQLHLRDRQYDPASGRFTGMDPVDDNAGASLYAYVGNQPGVYADPSGQVRVPGWLQTAADGTTDFITGAAEGTANFGAATFDKLRHPVRSVNELRHACDGIFNTLGGGVEGTLACIARQNGADHMAQAAVNAGWLAAHGCMRELGQAVGPDLALSIIPGGFLVRAGARDLAVGARAASAGASRAGRAGLTHLVTRNQRGSFGPGAPRFGRDDLVYGPSAGGALRRWQRSVGGGRLLTDLGDKPTGMSWDEFSVDAMEGALRRGDRIHFDLTHMDDLEGVLNGTAHVGKTTTAELHHLRSNWGRFQGNVTFYRDGSPVSAPW